MKLNAYLHTDGHGYWSTFAREVKVYRADLHCFADYSYGELLVFFTKKTWDSARHGLIYTDKTFLVELVSHLKSLGLRGKVDYSEQGMQGRNFVSLDVNKKFINSWKKIST